MHLVTAIIKPHRVEPVRVAMTDLGVNGMTIMEVKGFGRQRGHTETYRSAEYDINFLPKIRVDVVVSAEMLQATLDALQEAASTGSIGDGKAWVTDLGAVVRLRTGERDDEAL